MLRLRATFAIPGMVGVLTGCGLLPKKTTTAQVETAYQNKDAAMLADTCMANGGAVDVKMAGCERFMLLQAARLEEAIAKEDRAYVDDVCAGKVTLDEHPTKHTPMFYVWQVDRLEEALPPAIKKAAAQRTDYQITAKVLACAAVGLQASEAAAREAEPDPLDPAEVASIAVDDLQVCPGQPATLHVQVTLTDGTTKGSWTDPAKKHGFVDHAAFDVTSATASAEGLTLTTTAELPKLLGGVGAHVALAGRPDIATDVTLGLRFDCMEGLFVGGEWGQAGAAQPSASGYPTRTSGTPRDGDRGPDGDDGGDGAKAASVTVDVGYADSVAGLLLVARAQAGDRTVWFARAAADAPQLVVVADGGAGGAGGWGGGGGGAEGAMDADNPNPGGKGGDGGNGGNGGNGGDGNSLTVRYDKAHPELAKLLQLSNSGGRGGDAGQPGRGGDGGSSDNGMVGPPGIDGVAGVPGKSGKNGPKPTVQAVAAKELFKGAGLKLK